MVGCLYLTVQLITILAKTVLSVKVPPELKTNEKKKQAGAELCQAQFKLGLAMPTN
jgi:hypothetical protein